MKTAVVSEKPNGRVVSFLPEKELRIVSRKKEKIYSSGLKSDGVLQFTIDSKKYNKIYPFSFNVDGQSANLDTKYSGGYTCFSKLSPVEIFIKSKHRQIIKTEPLVTVIKLGQNIIDTTTTTSFKSLTFEVEDTRPIQSIITNGGNVETMQYTMQQQSFYEVNVKFKDADIVSVSNLPLGMILEKGVVKGCPIYSGLTTAEFLLSNGDTATMTFKVSPLPRKL